MTYTFKGKVVFTTIFVAFGLLFLFLIFSANSFASSETKMTVYECPTLSDSMSCSSKCIKNDNMKWEFKVNVNKALIIKNKYVSNRLVHSDSLDDCKVVDEKNWVCKTVIDPKLTHTFSMTNGIYSFQIPEVAMCAK